MKDLKLFVTVKQTVFVWKLVRALNLIKKNHLVWFISIPIGTNIKK